MHVVMSKDFNIAFDKAKEVNKRLHRSEDKFVDTNELIKVVKDISGYRDISVSFLDFSLIDDVKDFGAMLRTEISKENEQQKTANIVVNSVKNVKMQRFSIAHELGHLITESANCEYETPNDGKYTISTHINADITYISKEQYEDNEFLKAEQIANIFALLVLIPDDISIKELAQISEETLSAQYGVTTEALYSRMLLSYTD